MAPDVPGSVVTIIPSKGGYVHPCETSLAVSKDLNLELELVPAQNPGASSLQPSVMHSLVTGTVLEMTPDGPTPLAGAYVSFETAPDLSVADTMTNLDGRFSLCDVTTPGYVYAWKKDYEASAGAAAFAGMTIVLKRR